MTNPPLWSARLPLVLGFTTLLALFVGCFTWSSLMPISGAVIAAGSVEMAEGLQSVQHPDGGRVAEIFVTEGARVNAGQLLLRLDGTATRSDLVVVEARLVERRAERARLEAERDGRDRIIFPETRAAQLAAQPDLARHVAAQNALFAANAAVSRSQLGQITRLVDQINEQVRGIDAQIGATQAQIRLLRAERGRMAQLVSKDLIPKARLFELDRELTREVGALGSLRANRAEVLARRAEVNLESLRLTSARSATASSALKVLLGEEEELLERRRALIRQLAAYDLRAPLSGVVLGLQTTSPASVLRPAEPAMYIVPDDGAFVVEARISATDIDQIRLGQPARLRIGAFDANLMPDLAGTLAYVAADAQSDQAGGALSYRVKIELTGRHTTLLRSGMPVEVFLTTGPRTALSYLLDPFTRSFGRVFRDG